MRLVVRLLLAAAAAALVAIAAVALVLWYSVPPLGGTARLPGLEATVEVRWDSLGVPHIAAANDRDAFQALGYVHARDRLWQMEVLRRAGEGRLAEVLGPAALASDRFLRSLDLRRVAAGMLAMMEPSSRALLDAYVAGVNAWIAAPGRPLPPEFQVLRFRPEPWRAEHPALVTRLMAWDLVNAGMELALARAAAQVGPERVLELFPVEPESGVVILPPGVATWRRGPAPRRSRGAIPSALLTAGEVPAIPPLAADLLGAAAMRRGSNSWVVGPARSRSGKPILANDPHLTLRAPSLWYLAAIRSPGFTVAGATIPGLPAVIIGRNARIAWGLTNIEADDVDYVIERLSADSSRVLTPAGWAPVEAVTESIRVRGRAAVPFVRRRTPSGPVLGTEPPPDPSADAGEVRVLALRWNGHEPSDELTAMLGVDRAQDWDGFLAAVSGFRSPEQNWVYADVDGNIGYAASGRIPVRRSGVGLLPTPGWTGEGRWERFLDADELPRAFNPPEGFLVTANNRVIGPEYPHLLSANFAPPHRAARIRAMILAGATLDAEAVRRMQMDTLDLFAAWARTLAAEAAAAVGADEEAALLRAWDGTAGADRREPALFWTWYRALRRLTFADEVGLRSGSVLEAWLRAGASPWFDDRTTPAREDLTALSRRAMREALEAVGTRRWGEIHVMRSDHALGAAGPLARLLRLNVGPAPRGGSSHTVNVADFGGDAPPFVNGFGPSFRQVVDLAAMDRAGVIITTGQTGHPLSRRYRDQAARWARGELWPLPLSGPHGASVATLRLESAEAKR